MSDHIEQARVDYTGEGLNERDLAPTPYEQLLLWIAQAQAEGVRAAESPEGLALQLATVDAAGVPNVRTVLIRFFDASGPGFVTDGGSVKSHEIADNPRVAASLGWPELFRVVRFRGLAVPIEGRCSSTTSGSGRGGRGSPPGPRTSPNRWAHARSCSRNLIGMPRSSPTAAAPTTCRSRRAGQVFRLRPWEVEFWAGRSGRLHDRIVFTAAITAGSALSAAALPPLNDPDGWTVRRRQP
ncbi:MAG: pyridoxamine 5'-phosphate oxidase family protein [Actinomycetales bacterium]|nr:pyridoxamine 5'-phosphate oxidase family protein [Actinomycetales bacterium]